MADMNRSLPPNFPLHLMSIPLRAMPHPLRRKGASIVLGAAALIAVAHLFSGVQVANFTSALLAAAVIGLFNVVLRPVLVVLTFPVTLVTLGLFLFVINALMFWAASDHTIYFSGGE